MPSICIYLQVHQPYRISKVYKSAGNYFDSKNKKILLKVSEKSYIPTNKVLLDLLKEYQDFKITFSFSGTVLEQMEKFSPETLKSFQELYKTGKVEILSETYYHSLAFFYSRAEFERQVEMHKRKIKKIFGESPKVFRNTELSYNNNLAKWAESKGYKGIITEGWEPFLKGRSPNLLYRPKGTKTIKAILKNYKLSDDIAFRFEEISNVKNFVDSIEKSKGDSVNLFMDYETFGEHKNEETGILLFLKKFPEQILKRKMTFKTVSETIDSYDVKDELDVPKILTWADTERDLTAWAGNKMQRASLKDVYEIEKLVLETQNKRIIDAWRRLQTSDHFYYMCTKWAADGDIHAYFSPFDSPSQANFAFQTVLEHLKTRIKPEK